MKSDGTQDHEHYLQQQTIEDFGSQWTTYTTNKGFYGSIELLKDILGPLLPLEALKESVVAEIGSGTGRIVQMLLAVGVAHVFALEPSRAVDALRSNLAQYKNWVTIIHESGETLSPKENLDFVFCIGVLHHIPAPLPTLKAALAALKPGGRLVLWVYGNENGKTLIWAIQIIRNVSRKIPDPYLRNICKGLTIPLRVYIKFARFLKVPLYDYARNVLAKLDSQTLELVIYDQLNPRHAKYYSQNELNDLLDLAGFKNKTFYHRHNYSWTVLADKKELN